MLAANITLKHTKPFLKWKLVFWGGLFKIYISSIYNICEHAAHSNVKIHFLKFVVLMCRLWSVAAHQFSCFLNLLVFRRIHYSVRALVFAISFDHLSESLLHAESRLALTVGLLIIQNLKVTLSYDYSIFSVKSCGRLSAVRTNISGSESCCGFRRPSYWLHL